MTTSISERANAYRAALRQGLNDGHTIKAATDLAKKAARECSNNFPEPPMGPVELTDEELRLIDENELTADECDRLDELDQAAVKAEEDALNDTLPKASLHGSITAVNKSSILQELATALGYRVIEIPLSDVLSLDNADTDFDEGEDQFSGGDERNAPDLEGERFMADIRTHELMEEACGVMLKAPGHIQLTIEARRAAKLEGNCEDGYEYEPGGLVAQAISDAAKEHGDEPVDLGDFGAGTLADAWRDGVGINLGDIKTPAGLRIKAKAAFMAGLSDDLDAEKDCVGADEGCQCESCHEDDAAEWAAEERRHQAERDEECPTTIPRCVSGFPGPGVLADIAANRKPRDCDIPATLRAIEIPATEHSNSIRQWFDGDDEMQQFLAGQCLYADADRSIKDDGGKLVGMWFYAHFGPTPVS